MGKSCAVAPSGNAIDLAISMLRNFSMFHLQNPPLQSCIKAEESPFILICWPSLSGFAKTRSFKASDAE